MIRLAQFLAALLIGALSAPIAQACVTRPVEDLLSGGPLSSIVDDGAWNLFSTDTSVEGFCATCADGLSFMISAHSIDPVDPDILRAFLEQQRAQFCSDLVAQRAGQCLENRAAPLLEVPGYVGLAEIDGELLYTDTVVCPGYAIVAQVGAQHASEGFNDLTGVLRFAIRYLTIYW